MRQALIAFVTVIAFAGVAGAQQPTAAAATRTYIDTTWTFNVSQQSWNQAFLAALVGGGVGCRNTSAGTTTAPDSARSWSACVGAQVELRNVNMMLRGARGSIHLRADLRSLTNLNATQDSASKPE